MNIGVMFVVLFWSGAVAAAHSYGGMDLCTTYPEKMPPGIIDASHLPDDPMGGAALMQHYCEQCHYLPGPGRHIATEWPALLKQMNLLMDVSNRFGNLMGKVVTPTESEREIIKNYLINNALIPMEPIPEAIRGHAYVRHCGSCHALPDPKQHTAAQWPQVVDRMLRSMVVMKYSPPDGAELREIEAYLQNGIAVAAPVATISAPPMAAGGTGGAMIRSGTLLALGPFILLALIGVMRWYRNSRKRSES
jgi:cytochrome c2